MNPDGVSKARFPAGLVEWAGHRAGGVRRLFDEESGRPSGIVIRTGLLNRLETWVEALASGTTKVPRVLLLVGGPGNGKTEAIESTVNWIDAELGAGQHIVNELRSSFFPPPGVPVPRLAKVQIASFQKSGKAIGLSIVQDATVVSGPGNKRASHLLLEELREVLAGTGDQAYLGCVNRGILDDALIAAIEAGDQPSKELLESITRAVSLTPSSPPCWPLSGYEDVAVWPMDAESLFTKPEKDGEAPARTLFRLATLESSWPPAGSCEAGTSCPFCRNRNGIASEAGESALLKILRWYELGSGKRWSFRELFSLASYLLSGNYPSSKSGPQAPCEWAAQLVELDERAKRGAKPNRLSSTAIFSLVSSQYEHALFHRWDRDAGGALLKNLKELGLENDNTAMGLAWFLNTRRSTYLPATIAPFLEGVVEILDPCLANPDTSFELGRGRTIFLRDIDVRFSRSVAEGLAYVKKFGMFSEAELDLVERLSTLDGHLSTPLVRRRKPTSAGQVQRLVRDYACRLIRRTIGARTATVLDGIILGDFQRVIEDEGGDDLYYVAREVERLLNSERDFEISLTTTFGQPLPPANRRAMLVVPARPVEPMETSSESRPQSPIAFLKVGTGKSVQSIALTFDLFKAVKELERGMSPAALPRSVVALLDTARARLSGPMVRDPEILDRARIKIGAGGLVVEKRRSGFASRKEDAHR